MRGARVVSGVAAAALLSFTGCAASEAQVTGAPSSAASSTPPVVRPTETPEPRPAVDPLLVVAHARVAAMSLEQRAASILMLHAPGVDPAAFAPYASLGIGGAILMGDNVPDDPATLAGFVDAIDGASEFPLLIATDEEGGIVQRLPWDTAADAATLRDLPPEASRDAFAARGATLAAAGVSVNFGIVADVTADPSSFIFDRVLGTDPASAATRVAAAAEGEATSPVASTLKHFPGHGSAPGDSHATIPVSEMSLEEWRAGAAPPFAAGVAAGAELVMTGHLAYPAIDAAPATLSHTWHELLRGELGFTGVVVTDDMLMLQHNGLPEYADPLENAIRAIDAGSDLLLYVLPADPASEGVDPAGLAAGLAAAARTGRLPEARLDDAATRVAELRLRIADRRG